MRVGISRKTQPKPIIAAAICAVLASLLTVFFAVRATPVFRERAADTAAQCARRMINEAAEEVFSKYSDDMSAKETDGELAFIRIDSIKLNMLRAEFTSCLMKKLAAQTSTKIYISAGSLLKCEVFQGMGVRIPVKITYGSICDVDFKHEFITAGINQTKYLVTLKVTVTGAVISAFMCDTRDIEVNLPVAESIIIGKVPQYYADRMCVAAKEENSNG